MMNLLHSLAIIPHVISNYSSSFIRRRCIDITHDTTKASIAVGIPSLYHKKGETQGKQFSCDSKMALTVAVLVMILG